MSRLTNDTRQAMARALVLHRYTDRANELLAESRDLFDTLIDGLYPAPVRAAMNNLLALEPRALNIVNSYWVNVRGMRFCVGDVHVGPYKFGWHTDGASRSVLAKDCGGGRQDIGEDHPLASRLQEWALACKKFSDDTESAYKKALGTLGQFSTGKRLAEEWPEAMPVIGHLIPKDSRTLPVVQVASLNAEFDLPPEDLAA